MKMKACEFVHACRVLAVAWSRAYTGLAKKSVQENIKNINNKICFKKILQLVSPISSPSNTLDPITITFECVISEIFPI